MQSDFPNKNIQQNQPQTTINYYANSILRQNAIQDLVNSLTSTECLDSNVERFLIEMADNFVDTVLESASQIAKHKKSDRVTVEDLVFAVDQNFDLYEPGKYSTKLSVIKTNEIKNISTNDHKKRLDLTKEETKNVNI